MEVSFGTLRLSIAPTVYEPAEDSFLLATYASSLVSPLGLRVLDMGAGCGIAALCAAQANPKNEVIGLDKNPAAVGCARENAKRNEIGNARFLESDLFSAFSQGEEGGEKKGDGLEDKFDAILFNPPYLPTTREERFALEEENLAYDGGEDGMRAFEEFASQVGGHLEVGGRVAVIATSLEDGIKRTLEALEANVGPASILAEEKFFFEKIAIVEAVKR